MIGRRPANSYVIVALIHLLLMMEQGQTVDQDYKSCYKQYGVEYCYDHGPKYPRDKVAENIALYRDVTEKMYGPKNRSSNFKVFKNIEPEVAIEGPSALIKVVDSSTSGISNEYKPAGPSSITWDPQQTTSTTRAPRDERSTESPQNQPLFLGYLPPRSQQEASGDVMAPSRYRPRRGRGRGSFRSRSRSYNISRQFIPASMPERIRANSQTIQRLNWRHPRLQQQSAKSRTRTKRDLPAEDEDEDDDLENCCPSERIHHMPPWMKNSRGEWRVIVDEEPFVPRIQTARCLYNTTRHCRNGCRCVQQMTTHTLLAFDENSECSGIFNDEFLIPSECVCRCPKSRK